MKAADIHAPWSLKAFRQNAAMAAVEGALARRERESAQEALHHTSGSTAYRKYLVEMQPRIIGPAAALEREFIAEFEEEE